MPTALLAGVPLRLVRQATAALSPIMREGAWKIKFVSGSEKLSHIGIAAVDDLLKKAADLDSAHIVGFQQTGDRSVVAQKIRQHFRFRWGDAEPMWAAANDATRFLAYVREILAEEELWREHVMPRDKSSPLILPANLFTRKAGHEDIWEACEIFGRGAEHYTQLAKKIDKFERDHRKAYTPNSPMFMVDRADLVWKDAGPYHGSTPFPKQWKYSLKLIDAFHYDVEHQKGTGFTMTDSAKSTFSVKSTNHANIDCHGYRSHKKK
ncbi:hypothetical protein [Janthinobacterium sp. RB2R34]|uniref:hypothetical protein n=1 Tax=Janthinobacterium sp. RB2R34 TaxID=3424193 RepID=UPI003F28D463